MRRTDLSRRALLRVGGLGVVGLAGCLGQSEDDGGRSTDRSTGTPTTARTIGRPTTEGTAEPTEEPTDEPTTEASEGPPDRCTADPTIDGTDPLFVAANSRELRKCAGRPLDSFDELSAWEPLFGSVSADSEGYVGDQSALLETTDGPRVEIRRRFPEGIDLSDRDLSVAVDLERPSTERLSVRLFAPDAGNELRCERFFRAAGWHRLDVGPTDVTGSPDLTDVREIHLRLFVGQPPLALSVDSLRTTERADRGAVVLTFDDNRRSQYETAFPITERYGFPGVVGVITDSIDGDIRIGLEGMSEMQAAGWEMVSHPHPEDGLSIPELSTADKREQLRSAKEWLVDNGFERGARHVIWPYNAYDAETLEIASRYHSLGFGLGRCPVGRQVTGPLSVGRVHGDEVERSKAMIDRAARYNELVVIMYHTIGEDDDRITEAEFEDVMAHIDRADVDVITASDLWESQSA